MRHLLESAKPKARIGLLSGRGFLGVSRRAWLRQILCHNIVI